MNIILTIFNFLGGIAALIFFYDRFGHLFYRRKPEGRDTYNIFAARFAARPAKSAKLKHIRTEGSGLVAGIILGLSGTIFGSPGYLIVGLLGMVVIAFCYWREDRKDQGASASAVTDAVTEILAITGIVLSTGSVSSVLLGLVLSGLLEVGEKSYPGSLASILTLITTSAGGLAFGCWARDL